MYQTLLCLCKLLKSRCKQYQKAKEKGRTVLTMLTAVLIMHEDILTVHSKCGYSHPHNNCPAYSKECYKCNDTGNFTTLHRKPCRKPRAPQDSRPISTGTAGPDPHASCRGRQAYHGSSRSLSVDSTHSHRFPHCTSRCSSTLFRHQQDSLNVSTNHLYFDSITTSIPKEGSLVTNMATNIHITWFMMLQLITKQGIKALTVKTEPKVTAYSSTNTGNYS